MRITESPYHERIKAKESIPYYQPWLGEEELAHLTDVIRNDWISEGPKTAEFERRIAQAWGVKHAIAVSNCTAALIISLKALGIGEGDEVIAPAFTFIATINAIRLAGVTPVLVDIDARTFNIDPDQIEAAITSRTKAIVPVHLYGQAADMERIMSIAHRHGLHVIEDTAQGVGVRFLDRSVGSFGDFGCLSFFADKSLTTGEGGVVLTNSDELATEIQYWKNDGRLERGLYYHYRIGYNFRVTDLQMAVGLGQMDKLEAIVQRKLRNERLYRQCLADVEEVAFPYEDPRGDRVPHRVNILVDDPEALAERLAKEGIGCRRFFIPINQQPCYNGAFAGSFPNAEVAYSRGLSLPSSPLLREEQIAHVSEQIRAYFKGRR
ncbi:MAG: DegT/DnrJ/EryC1/StrS family aminotransferase [Dehalococcoidia bacterium]